MDYFFNQHKGDNTLGIICGILGGFYDLISKSQSAILSIDTSKFNIETILMAFICAVVGVIGKNFAVISLKYLKRLFKRK